MRVLYVDIDTTRADHLSCYGYHRVTSPNIDRVAAEGVRFENFYASDTPCLPSRAALFTGRHGIHSGIVNHGQAEADLRIVPELRRFGNAEGILRPWVMVLQNMGYYPVTFSPYAERHAAWWFYEGYREIYNPGKRGNERAEEVVPQALGWLEKNGQKDNWFLHVNVWDPHTPYRTPMEYGSPFENEPPPSWMTDALMAKHRAMYGPHSVRAFPGTAMRDNEQRKQYPRVPSAIANLDDYKRWIDGYDTGIHYADYWAGKMFDLLRKIGVWDDTIVMISSDHGENQGELNVYGDHQLADHITHRVPFVIKGPGVRKGAVDRDLHYNLDLAPTLVELLGGAEQIPEFWDGKSFAPALTDGRSCGREFLVLSHACWSITRGVRFDRYLYIDTLHDGWKQALVPEMLFDLESDPHELNNLVDRQPALVQRGQALLQRWLKENLANSFFNDDPHLAVLHFNGPFHTPNHRLMSYADTVREIWGPEAADHFLDRHARDYDRYLIHCHCLQERQRPGR